MKISIDVDLEPSEIPLANELLQTLRLLTEHVKVKQRTSGTGQAPAAPPAAAPVTPAPVQAPVAAPVAAPVPAAAPLPSTPEEARQMFTQLISRLSGPKGPSQLDAVAAEAARVLGAAGPVPSTALTEQFNEALCAVAFDRENIARQQGVETYLAVLPLLPEAIRNAVKSRTISWVLGFLNQKRPGPVDLQGVSLQATAFAVLVQMDFVAADGTVQTMGKLLKAPDKRVAAVMTLCALVERCKDKIAAANPGFLDTTLGLLATHGMAEHRSAVEYVFNQLGRPLPQAPAAQPAAAPPVPAAAAAAAAPQQQPPRPQAPAAAPVAAPEAGRGPPPQTLTAAHRATLTSPVNPAAPGTPEPQSSIFSVAYDPYAQLMMTGGSDLPITLWTPDGRVQHQIPMPNNFFVSNIHLEPNNRLLIACGAPNEQDPTGAIKGRVALFDARNGYNNVGNVARDDIISLAGVTTIPNTNNMLVAELLSTHGPGGNLVGLYDYSRVIASGTADHQPLQRFIGHSDVVTAVAAGEGMFKDCFLSASKDKNVMVWDTRSQSPKPVATLGVRAGELRTTHTDMVTCIDVCGYNVMSASYDGTVALWDLRNSDEHNTITAVGVAGNDSPCLRSGVYTKWQAQGVVKAAMAGAPYDKLVAAATIKGLYLLDMSLPQPVAKLVEVPHVPLEQCYCEVKWCSGTKRFLAAVGVTPSLEVLECS